MTPARLRWPFVTLPGTTAADVSRSLDAAGRIRDALWRIYRRTQPPPPPEGGANFPWDDPDFSERMLREHLDQSHGAASRQRTETRLVVDWLWDKLSLREGSRVLDLSNFTSLTSRPASSTSTA